MGRVFPVTIKLDKNDYLKRNEGGINISFISTGGFESFEG
jgi:hypothetical protein